MFGIWQLRKTTIRCITNTIQIFRGTIKSDISLTNLSDLTFLFFIGSAPPSRSGSRVDLSYSGTLTAPATPQASPPVSPIRRRTTVSVSVPVAKEVKSS